MSFLQTSAFKPSLVLAMSLGLFACGGDKPAQTTNTAKPAETTAPANTAETSTATSDNADPNAKTLIVATTSDFAPFTFADEKGSMTGFDIDLLNAIAKHKELNIEYKPTSFDNIFTEVDTGLSDIAASAIFHKEDRATKYGLTKPYHTDKPVFFYRADNAKLADANIGSLADLNAHDLEVAIVGDVDGLGSNHKINMVKSEFLGFTGVLQGKYDVAFSDGSVLNHAIKSNPDSAKIELKTVPYQGDVGYVFVVNKENTELLNTLNEGIDAVTQSGELKQLEEKYGLVE